MKLLFIQLPLLDHDYCYINGNVTYAPATISSYLKKRFGSRIFIEQFPALLSNFASNAVIIRFIERINPQIVSFTCYVWNAERNLGIAGGVKANDRGVVTVFGGPEVNRNSWLLSRKREEVDFFVSGEGEWFFERFLENVNLSKYTQTVNGNRLIIQPEAELIPSADIEEPFLNRRLNTMADGSIFIELVRGCPYRCIYCYYSKNSYKVRQLPFDRLINAVEKSGLFNIREIYILAPTFNRIRGIDEKLELLCSEHHNVRLHTEMRADGIDRGMARMLYNAGFRSLEIGIQTLNKRALRVIGRNSDVEDEIRGMAELRNAGIDLKIGLIPGLPGDNPEDFRRTIDRLAELGFGDSLEIYPLMVLPGTMIREKAESEGVVYQKKPPYFMIKGWEFESNYIRDIIQYSDDVTGFSYTIKRLPDFTAGRNGILINSIGFHGDNLTSWDGVRYRNYIETNVFSFRIRIGRADFIEAGLRKLIGGLSCWAELINVIFEYDGIIAEKGLIDLLLEFESDSFQRRMHIFEEWNAGLKIMFYQIFQSRKKYDRADMEYTLIEPILMVTEDNYNDIEYIDTDRLPNLLVTRSVYSCIREHIVKMYRDDIERIAFEYERDQEDFYMVIGYEYFKMPFSFRFLDRYVEP